MHSPKRFHSSNLIAFAVTTFVIAFCAVNIWVMCHVGWLECSHASSHLRVSSALLKTSDPQNPNDYKSTNIGKPSDPNYIKLLQWNIRTSVESFEKGNKLHYWSTRRPLIQTIIKKHMPFTIAGISEGHIESYDDLQSMLPNHYHFHFCRTRARIPFGDNNIDWNLFNIIIWDSTKLKLLTNGDFEMSSSPMMVNTRDNGTADYRCAAWAYFEIIGTNNAFTNKSESVDSMDTSNINNQYVFNQDSYNPFIVPSNAKTMLFISTHVDTSVLLSVKKKQMKILETFVKTLFNDYNLLPKGIDGIGYDHDTHTNGKVMSSNFVPYVLMTADWNEDEITSDWYRAITDNVDKYFDYKWVDLFQQCRNMSKSGVMSNNDVRSNGNLIDFIPNINTCNVKNDLSCTAYGYKETCKHWYQKVKAKHPNKTVRSYFFDWPFMMNGDQRCKVLSVEVDSQDYLASDHYPVITELVLL